jgi:ribosomal protein S6
MNKYEAVVVFPGSLADDGIKDETSRIQSLISARGGVNIGLTSWGKKEVAYAVHGSKLGTYSVFSFDLPVAKEINELVLSLRLMERVAKFQIHKLSDKARKFHGNPKRHGAGLSDDSDDDFVEEDL